MSRLSRTPLTWVLLVLLLVASDLAAQDPERLFAVNGAGMAPSTLYEVDRTSGAATAIGPTGYTHMTALDFHPTTGVLYGIGNLGVDPTLLLVTIDTTTGVGTAVAAVTWPGVCPDPYGVSGDRVPDMSFNSAGTLYVWREPCDDIFTMNTANGVASSVGEAGISSGSAGIAFDSSDMLYLTHFDTNGDQVLRTVSTSTGAASAAFVIETCCSQNMLAFDENDVLYSGNRLGSTDSELVTINPTTGVVSVVGPTGIGQLAALAFEPAEPPLPTTAEECKKGGWQAFGIFKNQGDCVSFVATGGKNPPFAHTKSSRSNR